MAEADKQAPTGMVMDGVAASQAIDSSGEILDVEGCDISSLPVDGTINVEHISAEDGKAAPGEETVGRILYAHKVFGPEDCKSEREEYYWDKVRVPYIYIIYRLFDGAGHRGAQALAASIRDAHAHGEKILVRLSIEGATLERDGNRLKSSVARRVSATYKPCNRTCDVGIVADPNAPAGFDKAPVPAKDLPRGVLKAERSYHPSLTPLGGCQDIECDPVIKTDPSQLKVLAQNLVQKALTAGGYGVAPSGLTGGSALQREDKSLKARMTKAFKTFKAEGRFDRAAFRAHAKAELPEASDEFLDHFANVAEDLHVRGRGLAKKEAAKPKAAPAPKAPAKPKQKSLDLGPAPLTIQGKPARVPAVDKPVFDEAKGVLHTPQGSFPMYIPSRDKQPGAKESFHQIMEDKHVNAFHDYAMENWAKVHKLLKVGKLPPEVVMHATLFANLSPNTPVPMQELMYGHLVDSMRHTGVDATSPNFDEVVRPDWLGRDQANKTPDLSPEHWQKLGNQIRIKNEGSKRPVGALMSFMLANNKFDSMAQYHKTHAQLADLVNRHKTDARAAVAELMHHKVKAQLQDAMRARHLEAGKPDPGEYTGGPSVRGFAPKVARYTYGMMGGGNVVVPDTHFVRYLFGLDKAKDGATIDHVKNVLWNERSAPILEAIDRYYAKHHDAVQHMLQHPRFGQLFKDDPEAATFPAFWKNWVAIAPHERARGFGNKGAFNESTDHRPYWEAIAPFLKAEDGLGDAGLPARTATIHAHWAREYGDVPALFMYYHHLVPALLARAGQAEVENQVRKFEALTVDLRKAQADLQLEAERPPVQFAGRPVHPGRALTAHGPMALLHEDTAGFVAVPEDKVGGWDVDDLVRLPAALRDTHYRVESQPTVPVAALTKSGTDLDEEPGVRPYVTNIRNVPARTYKPYQAEIPNPTESRKHAEMSARVAMAHSRMLNVTPMPPPGPDREVWASKHDVTAAGHERAAQTFAAEPGGQHHARMASWHRYQAALARGQASLGDRVKYAITQPNPDKMWSY